MVIKFFESRHNWMRLKSRFKTKERGGHAYRSKVSMFMCNMKRAIRLSFLSCISTLSYIIYYYYYINLFAKEYFITHVSLDPLICEDIYSKSLCLLVVYFGKKKTKANFFTLTIWCVRLPESLRPPLFL